MAKHTNDNPAEGTLSTAKKIYKGKAYPFGNCIRNKKRSACGSALDMEIDETVMRNRRSV